MWSAAMIIRACTFIFPIVEKIWKHLFIKIYDLKENFWQERKNGIDFVCVIYWLLFKKNIKI